jgi:hypothetical protein
MKDLDIVTCPWRMPALAVAQTADMVNFRKQSSPEMSEHFKGMMQTVWSDAGSFLDGFYGIKKDDKANGNTPWDCFKALYQKIGNVAE